MAAKWATMGLIALCPLEHRPPELFESHGRTLAATAVVLVNKFIVVHVCRIAAKLLLAVFRNN